MDTTQEKTILDAALKALEAHGVDARLLPAGRTTKHDADGRVELRLKDKPARQYVVEVKRNVTPTTVGAVVEQLRRMPKPALLATGYVGPEVAERLKAMNVEFMDMTGNAYLQAPGVLVWVKGNRPARGADYFQARDLQKRAGARAFEPGGLRILFAFLCDPELVNRPYREIAKKAGVAHGTVGWTMAELPHRGYLYDFGEEGGGRKLRQIEQLLMEWAAAYARKLRPKLILGRYTARNPDFWKKLDATAYGAMLGAEPAAAKLTRHLKPQIITIYADRPDPRMLLDNALRADTTGHVEVAKRFWNFETPETKKGLAPLPLIYGDLLATGDPRCIETAGLIRDQYLARLKP